MIALQTDPAYRDAIAHADLAIADSGWMVVFWRILRGEKLTRISGLKFFKCLLELPEVRTAGNLFWVLPSETAKQKTLAWAKTEGFPLTSDDCYVAPRYLEKRPLPASRSIAKAGVVRVLTSRPCPLNNQDGTLPSRFATAWRAAPVPPSRMKNCSALSMHENRNISSSPLAAACRTRSAII